MKKSLLPLIVLLACVGATTQAAAAECAAPVFPSQSVSSEGVRRVEKQMAKFRKCQAQRASGQEDTVVEANFAKWEASTRMYANGQVAGSTVQSSVERDQREHLASRTTPMRPVYGSERQ